MDEIRLIDANALKKALKSNCKPELCHDYNTAWCESCCQTNDFEDLIDNAPTINPERPQGEWITTRTMIHDGNPYCSICDEENIIRSNFCPNCGADMRKGGKE